MATAQEKHIEQLKMRAAQQKDAVPGRRIARKDGAPINQRPQPARPASSTSPRPIPKASPRPAAKVVPRTIAKQKVKKAPSPPNPENYFWYALPLFIFSIFLIISCLSYLFFWQADQNLTHWGGLFENIQHEAMNWGGRVGAIFSEDIIGRLFGIFGLLLPILLLVVGLKMLRVERLKLHKTLRSITAIMLFGSLAMGHFAGVDPEIFGTGLGGEMGIYAAQWLHTIIGNQGTTLLVVAGAIAILYFANAGWIRRTADSISKIIQTQRTLHQARVERELEQIRLNTAQIAAQADKQMQINAQRAKQAQLNATKAAAQQEAPKPETVKAETIEPESHPMEIPRDENLIELDNGQFGYIVGANEDGEAIFYFLDTALLPTPAAKIIAAPLPTVETEIPEPEEVEFIIKSRPQEDESPHPEPVVQKVVVATYNDPSAQIEGPTTKVVHFAPAPGDPNFIVEQTVTEEQIADHVINLSEVYDPTLELRDYQKPPVELLKDHTKKVTVTNEELVENKNRIVETLANFGIEIKSIEATTGPTVTLYEIIPAPGVRISKIKNLEEDIALSLAALGIRIIAPIPGKGTIGIEVPNKNKEVVSMYSVIKSSRFQDSKYDLPIALGKNIQNETVVMDLAKMPHLLVAGATGQGKSVGLNAIITSLLYKKHPSELKFILVDPKKVELTLYAKLEKHFLAKMPDEDKAIITDTQKVIHTLNSVCIEMSDRYDLLEAAKVRNFKEYNEKFINRRLNPEKGHRYLPYFVVIIDEFADLIMTAGREVETPIARIAQLARAVGIHLIIATQRPSVNIITGVIRANFPARIAFRVATATDSRTILDTGGANQLVGQGDMLVSNGNEIIRVQCAFIDTPEVDMITEHIGSQKGYTCAYELPEYVPEGETNTTSAEEMGRRDSLFDEVARYVVSNQSGSASTIQRKFSIGFNRAGRIVDQLEAAGIVGKSDGSKARQVLISDMSTLDIIIG